ncbi:MAG TPA: alpha-amylase family protein [Acidobacteriaceae bacterium]|nr:alpha-amylase family protein [Acidobacteriaceae bacterium]
MDRRTFLKAGAAALPLTSLGYAGLAYAEAAEGLLSPAPDGTSPEEGWERRIRRVGQVNFTEHDPAVMNVEEWADYWASLKVGAVFASVTGIIAFYPTNVPFFRRSKFLGGRDFFGECLAAAKKRGIHVVARMSPDLNWPDALQAHPEWSMRDAQGDPQLSKEDPRLFKTCMFSTYMTDYVPAVMREVNSRYDVDALYTNGWPPLGSLPVCHCEQCKRLPASGTPAYWDKFNERVFYLWKLYDGIAKEKKSSNFFFANLGGGIRPGPNVAQLGEFCSWFQCDNQGRGGEDAPIWGCALQGRVCSAVLEKGMSVNVTGAYSTGPVRWRNSSKSPVEATMWLSETAASGMLPYYHFVGAEKGLGEDRRWQKTGYEFFNWIAKHDQHFTNRRTIANIGVVMGQRTQLFYKPPQDAPMRQYMDGMYYALLEGRFLFDFVHEDKLQLDKLKKYSALILPNTALLSDTQCEQLKAYVDQGGGLLATFETSMYTERNERRADFGLGDLLGIRQAGPVIGTNGNAYYARIKKQHPILEGFEDTNWLPGAQYRLPVAPIDSPVLTVVPGFVAYPPELAYPPQSETDEPAVVLRQRGKSRLAYFPGDIDRTLWHSGNTDLTLLLQNSIRWVAGAGAPIVVEGDGLVETIAWETQAGFAVHILNYNTPNAHRGWMRKVSPIGEQRVRMQVPAGRQVTRVELLRTEKDIPFHRTGDAIEFTIPGVADYEVAALSSA